MISLQWNGDCEDKHWVRLGSLNPHTPQQASMSCWYRWMPQVIEFHVIPSSLRLLTRACSGLRRAVKFERLTCPSPVQQHAQFVAFKMTTARCHHPLTNGAIKMKRLPVVKYLITRDRKILMFESRSAISSKGERWFKRERTFEWWYLRSGKALLCVCYCAGDGDQRGM